MEILPITAGQAQQMKDALALVRDVFWEFEAADYSDDGVWEFDSFIAYPHILAMMQENRLILWAAYEKAQLVGVFGLCPPCNICLLAVAKRWQRRGIARALFTTMLRHFRRLRYAGTVSVNSSPYTLEVYRRLGFSPTGPAESKNGTSFTPMSFDFLEK